MIAYVFATQAQLEDRLSAQEVKQIYDDNNDGVPLGGPVTRLLADASSKIAGVLRADYDLDKIQANTPNEVVRLTLDAAEMFAAKRHPEYVRRDWEKLSKALEAELAMIRDGKTRLDSMLLILTPANEGGTVTNGSIANPGPPVKMFGDGTGIF